MAYVTPGTVAAGDVATAAAWNVIANDVIAFRDSSGIVPDMASASKSLQSLANNTWTFASMDTQVFDTNAMFSPTDTKITIQKAGVYIVTGLAVFTANVTGVRYIRTEKNAATPSFGVILTQFNSTAAANASGEEVRFSVTSTELFAASDTVHLSVYQGSGGALTTSLKLSVVYVGATS
jgi:hypothetical protein